MEFNVLNERYKELAEKLQQATSSSPMISVLVSALMTLFESLVAMFTKQSEQLSSLTKQLSEQKALNEKLLNLIGKLEEKLGNKTITVRKVSNENINGKGIDSSSRSKTPKPKKKVPTSSDINVTEKEVCIDVDGRELSLEDARKKIGTIFTGKDGKRYKYIRINASSDKLDIELSIIKTHYSKLQVVAVDEHGNERADAKVAPTVYPKTDFLKKSTMSISTMSFVLEQWLNLKTPLNRISQYLSRYGIKYTRQQLYSYIDYTALILMPVFKHMEQYISEAHLIGVDETYWSCREKQRLKENIEDDEPLRKSQRSKSKTQRSYVFGIITKKVCLYYHSLERNSDLPKNILLDNKISEDCFVESDAFYKKLFSIKVDEDGRETRVFRHGICWVHARRNFCELLNYATHKDGTLVTEIITNNWELDIKESQDLVEKITNCFNIYNTQVKKCMNDARYNIVRQKNKHVKPLIDEIFDKAHAIFEDIKRTRLNSKNKTEPTRKCSDRFYKSIVYLINNEERLRAFLDSPYGVMQNNNVEEKFRELDLLRNGMVASDTQKGAENLTVFYSFYKTCILHNTDFRTYMKKVIDVMTLHMNEIELEKDNRGTITAYKGHKIPSEVLDKLMPWNMA